MPDKNAFAAESMSLVDFKMMKGQVDTPENFDTNKVTGHQIGYAFQLAFNLVDKLAKADFSIEIKTDSTGKNEMEATGNFHLIFFYSIENLEKLATPSKNNRIDLHPELGNALSSVTYSTSRGILLTRLQGTALENFVLPIISPNTLLSNIGKKTSTNA